MYLAKLSFLYCCKGLDKEISLAIIKAMIKISLLLLSTNPSRSTEQIKAMEEGGQFAAPGNLKRVIQETTRKLYNIIDNWQRR